MTRELDTLLRACIECALCLPHCATYLATGDETRSPRGRLLLLREALADPSREDDDVIAAFDTCLGCRACETACPSGVPFDLLQAALDRADAALGPSDGPVIRQLSSRPALKALRGLGAGVRGVLRGALGADWARRLDRSPVAGPARRLGTLPVAPGDRALVARLDALAGLTTPAGATPSRLPAADRPGMSRRVVLFAGCASAELLPAAQARLLALLRAAGVDVDVPAGQDCCGALAAHTGSPHRAEAQRARNRSVLAERVTAADALIVEAAGCGLELSAYPDPVGAAAVDAAVYLADLPLPDLREVPLKVAYHDPCHARHGRGIVEAPRRLLARLPGVTVIEPEEADVCCGSGGAYTLRHPELSAVMGRRKAGYLAATGADAVVTSNPGCLGQIAGALAASGRRLPVLPLTDLIWYATLS